jgi:(R,R)-butanediol dehydrogenase/meso-butanediol dehydrogenase/diacetyl reductase
MQCAVLAGPEHVHIEERPDPEPGIDEALVEVKYVAICGSDQDRFWSYTEEFATPVIFGHEFAGRLVSTPVDTADLVPGQPVTVAPLFNCGACEFCRTGRENLCGKRQRFGSEVDGALANFVSVPSGRVFPLPDDLPIIEGALVEPLAVSYHAVRCAGFQRQGNAVVIGAGAIGLLVAQVWRELGKGPVIVVDIDEHRLSVADQLGFPTWTAPPGDSRIDTLFEASGSSYAFSNWVCALAPAGRAVIVGKLDEEVQLDWVTLLRKEAEIFTSRYFTLDDFSQSLKLLRNHQINLDPLIGKIAPFEALSIQRGKTIMEQAKQAVRLVIEM